MRLHWARQEKGRDKADYRPDMPPLAGGEVLVGHLFEVGPTMAGGMSAGPITHQEILAWQALTGTALQPFEARFLRRLSIEYLSESQRAEKRGCTPPWKPPNFKPEPTALQQSLRARAEKEEK